MGAAAQEHPQEAAKEAQGQRRPTELQISSTENIPSSCRIENITGGQLTPSPLHVSLSRWKVENQGWTFLPSGPPCHLLAFLGAWMWHLLSCFWCDAPGHGLMEPKLGMCSSSLSLLLDANAPRMRLLHIPFLSWMLSHQIHSKAEICWTSHVSSSFFVCHWGLKNVTLLWHRWEMLDPTAKKSLEGCSGNVQWEPVVVEISLESYKNALQVIK